ncbi:hypothetical protein ANCCEY_09655 [Ancylostoma ceylanicum]|uniref:Transposase n=1 Tax=Ancylostoma ceylanicum TaxID=53326 RepID=A0A0D6LGY6_9BILA|nr:hypothetical protein ANCCEY_09655 [Ancylostoma ceylanicum]
MDVSYGNYFHKESLLMPIISAKNWRKWSSMQNDVAENERLKQLQLEVLPQRSYSPDLAHSDYYLFKSLEQWLTGTQLKSEDGMKIQLSAFFESKECSFCDYGIRSHAHRWQIVIDHHDSYLQ